MPSPSNANGSVLKRSVSEPTALPDEFSTPISVSSLPSYGPWVASVRIWLPLPVTLTRIPQLVSAPIAGHCVNGAAGVAAGPVALDGRIPALAGLRPTLTTLKVPSGRGASLNRSTGARRGGALWAAATPRAAAGGLADARFA